MSIDSFEVVFFTVGFLVPGFVWSAVLSMLVPTKTAATEVRFLEFLTLSCINHGVVVLGAGVDLCHNLSPAAPLLVGPGVVWYNIRVTRGLRRRLRLIASERGKRP